VLAEFIKASIIHNGLLDGHYVELYCGGAGVAWPLLFEEYVRQVHINDISYSIYCFWYSVLNSADDLCKLINDTAVTIDEWHHQRTVQSLLSEHSILDVGFSTFFLNRTNRSGIIRGGVIGGRSQAGTWKLDARYNKSDLIARIERIARYKSRIALYNMDASEFIANHLPSLPDKTLLYLDPPYYRKGKDLYEDYYSHDDHKHISMLMRSYVTQPWIVSYDAVSEIEEMYNGCNQLAYDLSYSAQVQYAGPEVMFFSSRVTIPPVERPTGIKVKGNELIVP
jgi:DNA adenine methylase